MALLKAVATNQLLGYNIFYSFKLLIAYEVKSKLKKKILKIPNVYKERNYCLGQSLPLQPFILLVITCMLRKV